MSELSIFIDESGDFGDALTAHDYYLVTFVFHDQSKPIDSNVKYLEESLKNMGYNIDYIHTGEIIRREKVFSDYSLDDRRFLLYKILGFTIKCPIKCHTVVIKRKEAKSPQELAGKLSREISRMIAEHKDFFDKFEKTIVYYDNGQHELSVIISAILSVQLRNVEFRPAKPQKYRLLQSADFICSMNLLQIKKNENRLSKSEELFFYKPQELKKTFLSVLRKMEI